VQAKLARPAALASNATWTSANATSATPTGRPSLQTVGNHPFAESPNARFPSPADLSAIGIFHSASCFAEFLVASNLKLNLFIKLFDQPEDALTTQLNSSSRRLDCNSRNLQFSDPQTTFAGSVHRNKIHAIRACTNCESIFALLVF
jgi:hypothetical protein